MTGIGGINPVPGALFDAMDISGSGVDAAQEWINTTAGNLANANDTANPANPVYAVQTPVFVPNGGAPGQPGQGVAVAGIALGDNRGTLQYQPGNPLADRNGDVRVTDVDTGTQLVNLIQAQEDYQSNASAISRAVQAYQSALTLGS